MQNPDAKHHAIHVANPLPFGEYQARVAYTGYEGTYRSPWYAVTPIACSASTITATANDGCIAATAITITQPITPYHEAEDHYGWRVARYNNLILEREWIVNRLDDRLARTTTDSEHTYTFDDYGARPNNVYQYTTTTLYASRGEANTSLQSAPARFAPCTPPGNPIIEAHDTDPGNDAFAANDAEAYVDVTFTWEPWTPDHDREVARITLWKWTEPGHQGQRDTVTSDDGPPPVQAWPAAYFDGAATGEYPYRDYRVNGSATYWYQLEIQLHTGQSHRSPQAHTWLNSAAPPPPAFNVSARAYVHHDYPGGLHEGQPPPPHGVPPGVFDDPDEYGYLAFTWNSPPSWSPSMAPTDYVLHLASDQGHSTACLVPAPSAHAVLEDRAMVYPHDFQDQGWCREALPDATGPDHTWRVSLATRNPHGTGAPIVLVDFPGWSIEPTQTYDATSDPSQDGYLSPYQARSSYVGRYDAIQEHDAHMESVTWSHPSHGPDAWAPVPPDEAIILDYNERALSARLCEADTLVGAYTYYSTTPFTFGIDLPVLQTGAKFTHTEFDAFAWNRSLPPGWFSDADPYLDQYVAFREQNRTGELFTQEGFSHVAAGPGQFQRVFALDDLATAFGFPASEPLDANGRHQHLCFMDPVVYIRATIGQGDSPLVRAQDGTVLRSSGSPDHLVTWARLDLGASQQVDSVHRDWTNSTHVWLRDVHGLGRGAECSCVLQTTKHSSRTTTFHDEFVSRYNSYVDLRSDVSKMPLAGANIPPLGSGAVESFGMKYQPPRTQVSNKVLADLALSNTEADPWASFLERDRVPAVHVNDGSRAKARHYDEVVDNGPQLLAPWAGIVPDAGIELRPRDATSEFSTWMTSTGARPVIDFGAALGPNRDETSGPWSFEVDWYYWNELNIVTPVPGDPDRPWIGPSLNLTYAQWLAHDGDVQWRTDVSWFHNGTLVGTATAEALFAYDILTLPDVPATSLGIPLFKNDTSPAGLPFWRAYWYNPVTGLPHAGEQIDFAPNPDYSLFATPDEHTLPQIYWEHVIWPNAADAYWVEPLHIIDRGITGQDALRPGESTFGINGTQAGDLVWRLHYITSRNTTYGPHDARHAHRLFDVEGLQPVFGYQGSNNFTRTGLLTNDGTTLPLAGDNWHLSLRAMSSAGHLYADFDDPPFTPPSSQRDQYAALAHYADGSWSQSPFYTWSPYQWNYLNHTLEADKDLVAVSILTIPFTDDAWDERVRGERVHSFYLDEVTLTRNPGSSEEAIYDVFNFRSAAIPNGSLLPDFSLHHGSTWYSQVTSNVTAWARTNTFVTGQDCRVTPEPRGWNWGQRPSRDVSCEPASDTNPFLHVPWPTNYEEPLDATAVKSSPHLIQGVAIGPLVSTDPGTLACLSDYQWQNASLLADCLAASSLDQRVMQCLASVRHQVTCANTLISSPLIDPDPFRVDTGPGGHAAHRASYPSWPLHEVTPTMTSAVEAREHVRSPPRFLVSGDIPWDRPLSEPFSQNASSGPMGLRPVSQSAILATVPLYTRYAETQDERAAIMFDGTVQSPTPVRQDFYQDSDSMGVNPVGPLRSPVPTLVNETTWNPFVLNLSTSPTWTLQGLRQASETALLLGNTSILLEPYPLEVVVCFRWQDEGPTWLPIQDLVDNATRHRARGEANDVTNPVAVQVRVQIYPYQDTAAARALIANAVDPCNTPLALPTPTVRDRPVGSNMVVAIVADTIVEGAAARVEARALLNPPRMARDFLTAVGWSRPSNPPFHDLDLSEDPTQNGHHVTFDIFPHNLPSFSVIIDEPTLEHGSYRAERLVIDIDDARHGAFDYEPFMLFLILFTTLWLIWLILRRFVPGASGS